MPEGRVSPAIHQQAWWNRLYNPDGSALTRDDIQAFNLTPLESDARNKRMTQGLIHYDEVMRRKGLWIGWENGQQWVSETPIGKLAQKKWAKGLNDVAGEWGGFDWFDVLTLRNWYVLMSTPVHIENETIYYYPVAQGSFHYAASRFRRDPTVMAAKSAEWMAQQRANEQIRTSGDATTTTTGGGPVPGSDPYSYGGGQGAPMGTGGRRSGVELTLLDDGRIWYATTAAESASQQGPHPGLALAGPQVWDTATWGTEVQAGLPLGVRVLTADDPSNRATIRPAASELQTVMVRAQEGDRAAAAALMGLRISYNLNVRGWLGRLLENL